MAETAETVVEVEEDEGGGGAEAMTIPTTLTLRYTIGQTVSMLALRMHPTEFILSTDAPKDATPGSGVNTPSFRGRGRGNGNGFNTPRGGSATPNRGFNGPRGRGRPQYNTSYDDVDPGLGRGRGSPMDRGRGRGAKNMSSKLRAGAPLSKLLYEDRPFLRPIVFVRSVHTATLFEEKEDILKPLAEDVGTYKLSSSS